MTEIDRLAWTVAAKLSDALASHPVTEQPCREPVTSAVGTEMIFRVAGIGIVEPDFRSRFRDCTMRAVTAYHPNAL